MLRYVLNAYSFLLCNFMIRKDRWTNENRKIRSIWSYL
nr:MAG TPA: hypothetical protein [Caudoviricetes sp.]